MERKLLSKKNLELLEYTRIKLSNISHDFWWNNVVSERFTRDEVMAEQLDCDLITLSFIICNRSYLSGQQRLIDKYIEIGNEFRTFNAIARDDKGGIS